ncbi:hypothetical protein, partial [Bifidobacterium longum]|uniref:hypothetical protein n=1 Tax=Bifidobacterium longum TaxID=216816 RepID=UPI001F5633C5
VSELIIATGTGEDQSAQKLGHYRHLGVIIAMEQIVQQYVGIKQNTLHGNVGHQSALFML